jgi:hypothetical protein
VLYCCICTRYDELIGEARDTTHSRVEWTRAADSKELSLQDRWARAVGPPAIRKVATSSPTDTVDQLTLRRLGRPGCVSYRSDTRTSNGWAFGRAFRSSPSGGSPQRPCGPRLFPPIGDRIDSYREPSAPWVEDRDRRFGRKHRVGPVLRTFDAKWLSRCRRMAGGPGQRDSVDTAPFQVESFRASIRARAPCGGGCKGAWEFARWVAVESGLCERSS